MKKQKRAEKRPAVRILRVLALLLLLTLAEEALFGNTSLTVTEFTVASPRLPEAFDGFRVLHLSDLHDARFGKDSEDLIGLARSLSPDLIVITGDMIDSKRTDIGAFLSFAEELNALAPVYCCTGNHEAALYPAKMEELRQGLRERKIALLENESRYIERGGEHICLIGLKDIGYGKGSVEKRAQALENDLEQLIGGEETFFLVLTHRPEFAETLSAAGPDLLLGGHAHGGQVRLPLLGGLYAPGQGLLPRYDAGLYELSGVPLIVSRGLGNSVFPLRVFNRPELVLITLRTAE